MKNRSFPVSFSNLQFLFYFLPLFFAAYYVLPFRFKNACLVLGSALFYFWGAGAQDNSVNASGANGIVQSALMMPPIFPVAR